MNQATRSAFFNFNDAEPQQSFEMIPKGTTAKVRMTIRPGGHDDATQGWTGGWATRSQDTGAVFLDCEFIVLDGPYAKRKVWSLIGLHSPKGEAWANMGRTFLRAVLNSSRGISPSDQSPQAQAARCIDGFHQLDGLEFVARIDVEKEADGNSRNVIKQAIEPGHKDYAALMHGQGAMAAAPVSPTAPLAAPAAPQRSAPVGKPAWAQ